MTTTAPARLARLAEIQAELTALLTRAERRTYPVLEHLADLVEDLQIEAEES